MVSVFAGVTLLLVGQIQVDPQLCGQWSFQSGTIANEPMKVPARAQMIWLINNDGKILWRRTGEPDRIANWVVGVGLLTKTIDLTAISDDDQKTMSVSGICKLDGDTLLVAMPVESAKGKQTRPASFDPGKDVAVLRFERQKAGLGDAIKFPVADDVPAKKASALAGRWELIADKEAKDSLQIEFVFPFFSKKLCQNLGF